MVRAPRIAEAVTTISSPCAESLTGRSNACATTVLTSVTCVETKPGAAIATVNGPPTRRPAARKLPSASVTTTERVPDGTWVMVTVALETAAPASSTTVPRIELVVSWAWTAEAAASAKSALPRRSERIENPPTKARRQHPCSRLADSDARLSTGNVTVRRRQLVRRNMPAGGIANGFRNRFQACHESHALVGADGFEPPTYSV